MAISTRLHGLIDYAAAVSLGGLAASGALSGPSRQVAAVATAVPVGCFLATDFEAGLVRWVSMRRHLEFDVAWGALLCGTALAMRREPSASRSAGRCPARRVRWPPWPPPCRSAASWRRTSRGAWPGG